MMIVSVGLRDVRKKTRLSIKEATLLGLGPDAVFPAGPVFAYPGSGVDAEGGTWPGPCSSPATRFPSRRRSSKPVPDMPYSLTVVQTRRTHAFVHTSQDNMRVEPTQLPAQVADRPSRIRL